MDNLLGRIMFMLESSNKIHMIWCGAVMLTMIVLAVLHHRWWEYDSKLRLWRKLCLIPFLITTVHYFIYVSGAPEFLNNYAPMYLIAIIAFVPMLCADMEKGYRIFAPVTAVMTAIFGIVFFTSSNDIHNYTRKSYTKSFHAMVKELDRRYVLKEWKELDFSVLEEKYMPIVREAEEKDDPSLFSDAVFMFCNELHDGHVEVYVDYDDKKYHSAFELNDYGLSMVQLDSGEVIAVCTEKEINSFGIEDGTIITKWNGKPVLQAAEELVENEGLSVKANAERLAMFELSATGGETVEVTFIDKSGNERTAVLSARADEHTYDEAVNAFVHRPVNRRDILTSNFSTKMLNDECGYLRLSAETTGGSISDIMSFYRGECRSARKMFKRKLRRLKEQGMEYLVVDLRNNQGGYDEIGCALCELFTDEEIYAQGVGLRKDGKYIRTAFHNIRGDGEFSNIKVVALTNMYCVSAGDVTAYLLSKLPNVTLAGITDPNGSGQMTGGCCVLSEGIVSVSYPVGLTINEDGEPAIDTCADMVSRNPVEVRIPFDYDAAMAIFRDNKDYELDWAVNFLKNSDK